MRQNRKNRTVRIVLTVRTIRTVRTVRGQEPGERLKRWLAGQGLKALPVRNQRRNGMSRTTIRHCGRPGQRGRGRWGRDGQMRDDIAIHRHECTILLFPYTPSAGSKVA